MLENKLKMTFLTILFGLLYILWTGKEEGGLVCIAKEDPGTQLPGDLWSAWAWKVREAGGPSWGGWGPVERGKRGIFSVRSAPGTDLLVDEVD